MRIASDVAEALEHAHGHGVIHRDIKPANILMQAGKPVISDFGIALAVGTAGQGRLTETGLSMGTPHYMSPDQATGDLIFHTGEFVANARLRATVLEMVRYRLEGKGYYYSGARLRLRSLSSSAVRIE